jgi:hypothetical protein
VSETLIKRLRSKYPDNAAWDDAADEIERITARVQQLEAGISAITYDGMNFRDMAAWERKSGRTALADALDTAAARIEALTSRVRQLEKGTP